MEQPSEELKAQRALASARKRAARQARKVEAEAGNQEAKASIDLELQKRNKRRQETKNKKIGIAGQCILCEEDIPIDADMACCGHGHILCSNDFKQYNDGFRIDEMMTKGMDCLECEFQKNRQSTSSTQSDRNPHLGKYIMGPLVAEHTSRRMECHRENMVKEAVSAAKEQLLDTIEANGIDEVFQERYRKAYVKEIGSTASGMLMCPRCTAVGELDAGCTMVYCGNVDCQGAYCAWCQKDLTELLHTEFGEHGDGAHRHCVQCEMRHLYEPYDFIVQQQLGAFYNNTTGPDNLKLCMERRKLGILQNFEERISQDDRLTDATRQELRNLIGASDTLDLTLNNE